MLMDYQIMDAFSETQNSNERWASNLTQYCIPSTQSCKSVLLKKFLQLIYINFSDLELSSYAKC